MVRMRNLVKVGNREVKKRYIGNKLIFEDLGDKTEVLSGEEVYTDKADDSVVHVEVDGKSYQHAGSGKNYIDSRITEIQLEKGSTATPYEPPAPTPDYPVEIHSLNDFDVVSSVGGRNYFSVSFFRSVEGSPNPFFSGEIDYVYTLEPDTYYTLSTNAPAKDSSGSAYIHFGNFPLRASSSSNGVLFGSPKTILTNNEGKISITINRLNSQQTISKIINGDYKIRLEKGNTATDWIPAPEDITESDNHPLIDKINLSLNEPLRSVGDVHDRLFRDSDGLWKVERNVGEVIFDGTEDWGVWYVGDTSAMFGLSQRNLKEPMLKADGLIVSNLFPSMNVNSSDEEGIFIGTTPRLRVRAFYERIGTTPESTDAQKISSFKQWLSNIYTEGVPFTTVYEVESPITETLDQELQDKLNNLRSFQDSNYVYTVVDNTDILPTHIEENLHPTLHTTFKSKGWYDYYLKTLLK